MTRPTTEQARRTEARGEARRKMIADEFFAGDEAVADAVFDELPYSAIPEWSDVAAVARVLDAAGLLSPPTGGETDD